MLIFFLCYVNLIFCKYKTLNEKSMVIDLRKYASNIRHLNIKSINIALGEFLGDLGDRPNRNVPCIPDFRNHPFLAPIR